MSVGVVTGAVGCAAQWAAGQVCVPWQQQVHVLPAGSGPVSAAAGAGAAEAEATHTVAGRLLCKGAAGKAWRE